MAYKSNSDPLTQGPKKGSLIIIGGAATADVFFEKFAALSGGKDAEIVVIPTAAGEGFGFISNIAIDQHLLKRNRQFDIFDILDNRPELLGIGLDENTGILVQGNQFEVIGESYVAIYDGKMWSSDKKEYRDLPKGSREFYFLNPGEKYDLLKRGKY